MRMLWRGGWGWQRRELREPEGPPLAVHESTTHDSNIEWAIRQDGHAPVCIGQSMIPIDILCDWPRPYGGRAGRLNGEE